MPHPQISKYYNLYEAIRGMRLAAASYKFTAIYRQKTVYNLFCFDGKMEQVPEGQFICSTCGGSILRQEAGINHLDYYLRVYFYRHEDELAAHWKQIDLFEGLP
jgi:hypothetical protein